jgi:phosphoglycerate kinase
MLSIDKINFFNKKVLLRVDFNVPIDDNNNFYDMSRVDLCLDTIRKILNDKGSVILISHLGNPISCEDSKYSLYPLISYLSKVIGVNVKFVSDYLNENVIYKFISTLKSKEVILLENLRFHPGEKKCDENFAKILSKWGDVYVNDAFSASHRNHASITLLPKYFTSKFLGYLMIKEINNLNKFFNNSLNPVTVVLGGSKIATKLPIISSLIGIVDYILVGGAMANTLIKGTNGFIGDSLYDKNYLDKAKKIIDTCQNSKKTKIFLPIDLICQNSHIDYICDFNSYYIPYGWTAYDIGSRTVDLYSKILSSSKTVLWNGPMGVFEKYPFFNGTYAIAEFISKITKHNDVYSIIGGGDSIAAIHQLQKSFSDYSFISSGGGAMLKFLENKKLVGIDELIL